MNRWLKLVLVIAVFCLGASVLALGRPKRGPLSGAWACVAHGTDQGDINYSYNLTQAGDKVTGTFSEESDAGEKADITDGSYKDKKLDMTFEAHNGTVTITGTMTRKGTMSGSWTHSAGAQGTWDCTKASSKTASK
jgi:hypothetical protein